MQSVFLVLVLLALLLLWAQLPEYFTDSPTTAFTSTPTYQAPVLSVMPPNTPTQHTVPIKVIGTDSVPDGRARKRWQLFGHNYTAEELLHSLHQAYPSCEVLSLLLQPDDHRHSADSQAVTPLPHRIVQTTDSGQLLIAIPALLTLQLRGVAGVDNTLRHVLQQSFELLQQHLTRRFHSADAHSSQCLFAHGDIGKQQASLQEGLSAKRIVAVTNVMVILNSSGSNYGNTNGTGTLDSTYPDGDNEAYRLQVSTTSGIVIRAASVFGVQRAFTTLLQLFVGRNRVSSHNDANSLASSMLVIKHLPIEVSDRPRFGYRGLLIDTGRTFFTVPFIKSIIDGMALLKMNILHWHLTDDQSFSLEIKSYPLLHRKGGTWLGQLHRQETAKGMYYTQEQVRQLIQYAMVRGVRV
jgi:hypothetical protein